MLARIPFLQSFLVVAIVSLFHLPAEASLLFDDRFDGSSHADNAPLITEGDYLEHGIWKTNHEGNGLAVVSTEVVLSPPRALALSLGPEDGRTQVVGVFSEDGVSSRRFTDGYSLRFSFLMKDMPFDSWLYISGAGAQSVLVRIGSVVHSYHNGSSTVVATGLSADAWYTLEIIAPSIGSGGETYTVDLYDGAHELVGSSSGKMQNPEAVNYEFFTIYHVNPERALYIDDVVAETGAPR